ncbi:hypothetical protein AaE_010773 [Aphanomyces astaci]|uniref:Uncharacterized protein n=1 Tax=Aphanomyces astaci TaxID=112090 RepID=A0A6A4ZY70_APHAT|nr:hypothetical protein AaE_010773 [Aphanomyces astaci]
MATSDTVAHPFLSVLLNANLFRAIQAYQRGMFGDLVPRFCEWQKIRASAIPTGLRFLQYTLPPRYRSVPTLEVGGLQVFAGITFFLNAFVPDMRFPLHSAVVEGSLSVVQRWIACCGASWMTVDAIFVAIRYGHLHILRWLVQTYPQLLLPSTPTWQRATTLAASNDQLHVLRFLEEMSSGKTSRGGRARRHKLGHHRQNRHAVALLPY